MSAVFRAAHLARSGEQLVWFRRLGYVRIRDLARIAILVGVVLTALVTLLTSDVLILVFLILFAAVVLKLTAVDQ